MLQAPPPKFVYFWKVQPSSRNLLGGKMMLMELNLNPGPYGGNTDFLQMFLVTTGKFPMVETWLSITGGGPTFLLCYIPFLQKKS